MSGLVLNGLYYMQRQTEDLGADHDRECFEGAMCLATLSGKILDSGSVIHLVIVRGVIASATSLIPSSPIPRTESS